MKKYHRLILAALLVSSLLISAAFMNVTFADSDETGTITVNCASGIPGERIQVDIELRDNPGLASLLFNVTYDDFLTLTNVTFNYDVLGTGINVTAPEPFGNPQSISILNATFGEISTDGVIATLTFDISEAAPDNYQAAIDISYSPNNVFDKELNNVKLNVVNGKVSVHKSTAELNEISIKTVPDKTSYNIGESLNTAGLALTAKYNDNTVKTITGGFTVTGFSSATSGNKTVIVSYCGKSATFNVVVIDEDVQEDFKLNLDGMYVENGNVKNIVVINNSARVRKTNLIVAVYDMLGRMQAVGLKTIDCDAASSAHENFALGYTPKQGDVIKAFLLDGSTKAPVCKDVIKNQ